MTRREHVLAAFERLLHRYGPNKTTISDVAREAEISVGAVYLDFASKEALLEEISTRRHRAVLDAMRAAAQTKRPYAERLRAVIDARAEELLDLSGQGPHACDVVHCGLPAVKTVHAKFKEEELAIVVELLRAGTKAGELHCPKPEPTARAVLAAYLRFAPPALFLSSRDETLALLKSVHEIVLYGLVRR
ncbi:MAG: TetR/AcrR family transcriptional regulator [Polyangiales bacterium]